jgi:hypothetical protein
MISIALQNEGHTESDSFFLQLLRGFGNAYEDTKTYATVPILSNYSAKASTENVLISPTAHFKQSAYFVTGWADTRWKFRKNITIQASKVTSDLANFPVLVNLYDPDLQQDAQASGNDILFSDASGNILDHEIESYERVYNSTHSHLVAWVKMNLSSSQNTILSMYYGNPIAENQENPTAVWGEDYVGVWHLSEESGNSQDSTSYGTNGIILGGVTQKVTGQLGSAYDFDGASGSTVDFDNPIDGHLNFGIGNFSVSFWINFDQSTGNYQMPLYKGGSSNGISGYEFETSFAAETLSFYSGDGTQTYTCGYPSISYDTWYYIVGVNDRLTNYIRIYQDSVNIGSTDISSLGNVDSSNSLVLSPSTYPFDGMIDEVRLSKSLRSSAWIKAEYNNQKDPSTFYTIGAKEDYPTDGEWAIPSLKYRKNATQVSGSGNLVDFPVLVNLYDTDLHSTDKVQTNGEDIIFTDTTGTVLDHELELFDQTYNSTHAHLVAWVRVPSLSGISNTTISMYYGNKVVYNHENIERVWNDNYKGVWHLSESSGSGSYIRDSTNNNHDGDPTGTLFLEDGMIGAARNFPGTTNHYIEIDGSDIFDGDGFFTFSFWLYPNYSSDLVWEQSGEDRIFYKETSATLPRIYRYDWMTAEKGVFQVDLHFEGSTCFASVEISRQKWNYITYSYNGSYLNTYVNGSLQTEHDIGADNLVSDNSTFQFGLYSSAFNGSLDEFRYSTTDKTSNWIFTEYTNQHDPKNFYVVKNEEEYRYWFKDASFDYRKDILIDHTKVKGESQILTLRPNGVGHVTFLSVSGATDNYEAVDEVTYDTTTYVYRIQSGAFWGTDYYEAENAPVISGSTINSVTIKYRGIKNSGLGVEGRTQIYTYSQYINGDATTLGSSYANVYSQEYQTNPYTGEAWTWTEINNMEIGVGLKGFMVADEGRVTQLWAEVNYTKTEDLDNFPFLIDITSADLKTGKVQSDFDDILFTDINGTKLAHEIESTTQSSSEGHFTAWVNIPKLLGTEDIILSMYYGNNEILNQQNPEQVWSSNYHAVYHMDDSPVSSSSSSVTIRPDGAGTYSECAPTGATFNWQCVDEDPSDGDSSYVTKDVIGPGWRRDLYTGSDIHNKSGRIDKVTVYARARLVGVGSAHLRTFLRTNGVEYEGSDVVPISSYSNHFTEYTLNSQTNTFWTWNDINDLEFGVKISSDLASVLRVTTVWAVITYTPASIIDSTGYNMDLTSEGSMSSGDVVSGVITNGLEFDGNNDGLSTSTTTTLNDLTVSTWIYVPSGQGGWDTIFAISKTEGSFRDFCLVDRQLKVDGDSVSHNFGDALIENRWHYVTFTFDGSTIRGYINGTDTEDSVSAGWGSITGFPTVGFLHQWGSPCDHYGGILDEIRLTNDVKSSIWIATEFANQQNPSNFYTIGPEIVIDKLPPVINDFGVDDPGTGLGKFWADITDSTSDIASVAIKINATEYGMSFNGTYWIYQKSVTFLKNYNYQIVNASDIWENYITSPSSIKNYTFNYDRVAPNVDDWEYDPDTGDYGTFNSNVSDSWGVLDTVIVNITEGTILTGESWAVMRSTASGYMNDTLEMNSGSIKFTITVNDTAGNSFISSEHQGYVPIVNHAPVASGLTLSREENTVLQPIFSNCTLYLNYTYSDTDGDPEAGTEIRWHKNSVLQSGYDDQQQIPATALIKGEEWYATVKPKDNEDFGTLQTSETITIKNTAPISSNVIVSPSSPRTSSDLTVNYDYSDEDSDSEVQGNRLIRWYNNSTPIPAYDDSPTVPASATKKGQQWYYQIRVNDGANNSIWYTSNTETIVNTAPTASDVSITSNPKTGDNLVASWTYSDVDGDSENTNWHIWWYKNGEYQSNLDGVKIINSGNTTKGEIWKYTLQVFDGIAYSGNYTLTPTVQIQNSAPTIAGDPWIITSNPQTEDDLEGNWTFVDVDGDSQSTQWIIRWYKDGGLQSAYNNTDTVPSTATSKGEEWNFTVKVYDGTDYSIQYNSSIETIQNTAPTASSLMITTNPTTTTNLTASWTAADVDGDDPDTYLTDTIVRWYNWTGSIWDLIVTTDGNSALLEAGNTTKGETWRYELEVYDGTAYSVTYTSANTTILNTAPTATSLTLTPTNPSTSSNLVADWSFDDDDNDAQITNYTEWYRGTTHQPIYDGLTILPSSATTKNQVWYIKVLVNDGETNSTTYISASVEILNTPPQATDVVITPTNPNTTSNLEGNWTFVDLDGDSESTQWIVRWYKDGVLQSAYNNEKTVFSTATSKDERWNFTVKVHDGSNYSIQYNSSLVTILNTAPTASSLTIPVNPKTTDNLITSWTAADVDGDNPDIYLADTIIRWYNWTGSDWQEVTTNGVVNATTLEFDNTTKGEIWYYSLQVYDGTDYSIVYTSANTTILNSLPTVSNPSFNETSGVTSGDSINITYSYADIDGDTEILGQRIVYWYKDGAYQSSKDNDTILLSSDTTGGEFWQYIVRVYDEYNYSLNATSVIVIIGAAANNIPIAGNLTLSANTNTTLEDLVADYDYHDDDGHLQTNQTIRWYKGGVLQTAYNDQLTVPYTATSKGEVWNFTVKVFDGLDWSSQENSSQLTILNSVPIATELTITGTPTTIQNISISWTFTDSDSGDSQTSFSVKWFIDNTYNSTFNNWTTIPYRWTHKGETWNYTLTVYDGETHSILYNSTQTTILNTAPTASALSLTANPTTNSTLVVGYSFDDVDNDTEDSNWRIYWYKDNQYQPALDDSKTVTQGNLTKNEIWYYKISVYDGEQYSISNYTSPSRKVLNTAPYLTGLSLTTNPNTTTSLEASWFFQDNDTDPESTIRILNWYKDGTLQTDYTDLLTVPFSATSKGEDWNYTIQVYDGEDYSSQYNSSSPPLLKRKTI